MTTDPAKGLIGSLLHGLEILDMFERDRPEIGIGEMAQQLGLHRSTTSRLAATLAVAGYLEPAGEPGPVPPVGPARRARRTGRRRRRRAPRRPALREELEPHLCCVAGPVFDRTGTVVASISVSGPDTRIDEAGIPAIAEAVRRTAWQISARLGAPRDIPEWRIHDQHRLPRARPDGHADGRARPVGRP
jgi:IclR-like helix-turn-helix domain-containing protein/transcriptional regulator